MIIQCPDCQLRLRLNKAAPASRMQVRCPNCQTKFKVQVKTDQLKAFIAHEDRNVCQQLTERLSLLTASVTIVRDSNQIVTQFQTEDSGVLLLDVAFDGTFPFQLIEKIKDFGHGQQKIILLSSVYNRTAYKKRPDSLYGADAYLELHHIGDRLVPLLTELFPDIASTATSVAPIQTHGDERSLEVAEVSQQAASLAKLLVADIVLYNQDRMEQGVASGQPTQLFAEQLTEGRKLLASRLPATADLPVDFIQQAFDAACQSYNCS